MSGRGGAPRETAGVEPLAENNVGSAGLDCADRVLAVRHLTKLQNCRPSFRGVSLTWRHYTRVSRAPAENNGERTSMNTLPAFPFVLLLQMNLLGGRPHSSQRNSIQQVASWL